jgi:hypothetical protein
VRVRVTGRFDPIVPMVPISINTIESETARTIIRNVEVGLNFQPAPQGPTGVPPYVSFDSYSSWISESHGPYTVNIHLTDEFNNPTSVNDTRNFPFYVTGEAISGLDYAPIPTNYITIVGDLDGGDGTGSITIDILNDAIHENLEKIILWLDTPPNGMGTRQPWVHVIYIEDDDIDLPEVTFQTDHSTIFEQDELLVHNIPVDLTTVSGAPVSVGFSLSGTAERNVDFTLDQTGDRLYFAYDWTGTGLSSPITFFNVRTIRDLIPEGTKTVVFTLANPINAELGAITSHTVTIIDEQCNLAWTGYSLVNNTLTWNDIENEGVLNLNIKKITANFSGYSGNPRLNGIYINGVPIWTSSTGFTSEAVVPSPTGWGIGYAPLSSGAVMDLDITFSANIAEINSLSIEFHECPTPITISGVLP